MILLFKDSKHAIVNKKTSYLCNMRVCSPETIYSLQSIDNLSPLFTFVI